MTARSRSRPREKWLNLGAGIHRPRGYINVDSVSLPGIDVVADLDTGPWPWRAGEIGRIFAAHVFEHVAEPVLFMTEAWRILAPGGELEIHVPYYKHWHAFTDPTHRRFCTEHTFDYWIAGTELHIKFGAAYRSPPSVFKLIRRTLANECELQMRLEKLAS